MYSAMTNRYCNQSHRNVPFPAVTTITDLQISQIQICLFLPTPDLSLVHALYKADQPMHQPYIVNPGSCRVGISPAVYSMRLIIL